MPQQASGEKSEWLAVSVGEIEQVAPELVQFVYDCTDRGNENRWPEDVYNAGFETPTEMGFDNEEDKKTYEVSRARSPILARCARVYLFMRSETPPRLCIAFRQST